jgi:peptide/nickel transport system permease protein
MLRYFLKRLALFIPIIILVSFIVYGLMSLSGDPAQTIAGDDMTEEQIEMLREKMGLNAPFLIRYGRYIIKAMQGDFGEGLYGKNVWNEYISRLCPCPPTSQRKWDPTHRYRYY